MEFQHPAPNRRENTVFASAFNPESRNGSGRTEQCDGHPDEHESHSNLQQLAPLAPGNQVIDDKLHCQWREETQKGGQQTEDQNNRDIAGGALEGMGQHRAGIQRPLGKRSVKCKRFGLDERECRGIDREGFAGHGVEENVFASFLRNQGDRTSRAFQKCEKRS